MEGGHNGTYLRLTRASSGPRVSVAKTYRDEMKRNKSEYFSQITVAFLSGRIQETLYVLATLTRGPNDALVSLR